MTFKTGFVRSLIASSALALCAGSASALEMNFANVTPADSHYGKGVEAFADRIEELSGGDITISHKASGVLGGEREVLEGLQIGTIELTISSTGPIGNFVPAVYALDFPFLFDNYENARTILDGEIGEELLGEFEAEGIHGLAWGENGFRHISNSVHPVETPADLQGLKLRTMENQVHIDAFQELGASPTPMSWTEVLTSLQQGTIDGQENPIPIMTSNNMWDMQQYVSMTGHVYSPAFIGMSKIHWDQLTDEQKGWFEDAADVAAKATRDAVDEIEANGIETLREHGMEVVTDIDPEPFRQAVQPTYDRYAEQFGAEMIDRIRAAQASGEAGQSDSSGEQSANSGQ